MSDYKTLIDTIVADVFANRLPGLTVDIVIRYYISAGVYNAETDDESPVYENLYIPNVVKAKPTFEDVRDRGAVLNNTKLIVPGQQITREFKTEVDRVVVGGKLVDGVIVGRKDTNIAKVVGVPGDSVWLIYVNR